MVSQTGQKYIEKCKRKSKIEYKTYEICMLYSSKVSVTVEKHSRLSVTLCSIITYLSDKAYIDAGLDLRLHLSMYILMQFGFP